MSRYIANISDGSAGTSPSYSFCHAEASSLRFQFQCEDVSRNRFPNVGDSLLFGITLTDATGHGWTPGDPVAVFAGVYHHLSHPARYLAVGMQVLSLLFMVYSLGLLLGERLGDVLYRVIVVVLEAGSDR